MKKILFGAFALTFCGAAWAQVPPWRAASVTVSAPITSTGVFQSVFSVNLARSGCLIQNKGTHAMWVFFGAITDATEAKGFIVPAGANINCSVGNVVLTDQISITGTSGDTFTAAAQ